MLIQSPFRLARGARWERTDDRAEIRSTLIQGCFGFWQCIQSCTCGFVPYNKILIRLVVVARPHDIFSLSLLFGAEKVLNLDLD